MKKLQNGFTAVEGLLILVIVGIIGGVGYFVWSSNKDANDNLDSANSVSQNAPSLTTTKKTATNSTRLLIADSIISYCKDQNEGDIQNQNQLREVILKLNEGSLLEINDNSALAFGACSPHGSGMNVWLRNEKNTWKVLYAGQTVPYCKDADGKGWANPLFKCLEKSTGAIRALKL